MLKTVFHYIAGFILLAALSGAQTPAARPTARVIGTVTAVDQANQSVTVKQDKTGTQYTAELGGTRTILSVPPGTKPADLRKEAKRITPAGIHPGDRIELYYVPSAASGTTIAARAAVVMSANALQAAHSAEAEAWQLSTAGVISAVDPSAHTLTVKVRSAGGVKPITLTTTPATQFTRYSAENPQTPAPAELGDFQTGGIVRIIGQPSPDGSAIAVQKIYLAPKQLPAVVVSVSVADNTLTVKDLRNKQKIVIAVNSRTQIRRLPPPVAHMLARRLNPALQAQNGQAEGHGEHQSEVSAEPGGANGRQHGASHGPGNLSGLIERAPEIQIGDLKAGDAVVVSGASAAGHPSELLANTIVAGVEPIFESAPPRRGQSIGNWSLGMSPPPTE